MHNQRRFAPFLRSSLARGAIVALGLILLTIAIPAMAGPHDANTGALVQEGVATCVSETASLFRRPPGEQTWQMVKQNEPLAKGDFLVGLPGGMLDSKNGAVRLAFLADLD